MSSTAIPIPKGSRKRTRTHEEPRRPSTSASTAKPRPAAPPRRATTFESSAANAHHRRPPSRDAALPSMSMATAASAASPAQSSLLFFSSSPAPLVDTRYRLGGPLDTPTASYSDAHEWPGEEGGDLQRGEREEEDDGDLGYRRGRPYGAEGREKSAGYLHRGDRADGLSRGPLAREGNGRSRKGTGGSGTEPGESLGDDEDDNGWGRVLFDTVAGVAGFVWDFCRTGAGFQGFFAGGGKGYVMDMPAYSQQSTPAARRRGFGVNGVGESSWVDVDPYAPTPSSASMIPGTFPEADYVSDCLESPLDMDQKQRAAKKKRRSYAEDAAPLGQSWVLVSPAATTPAKHYRRMTYGGAATGYSPSPSSAARRSAASHARARRSGAGMPPAHVYGTPPAPEPSSGLRGASAAGLRGHARSSSHAASPLGHTRVAAEGAARRHSTATSGVADNQSPGGSAHKEPRDSPIVRETAKFMRDAKRRERAEDREMARFNQRLEDMIREGKEALGSTVEVDMGDDGDDWD